MLTGIARRIASPEFQMKGRFAFDCSLGIEGLPAGRLLAAGGKCEKGKGCTGSAGIVVPDGKTGLRPQNAEGNPR
jgi:hypothetical protein